MLFFVKVLVSGFRTPFTLHQVPETLFLNGGIKEFVHLKKKKKKTLQVEVTALLPIIAGYQLSPDRIQIDLASPK